MTPEDFIEWIDEEIEFCEPRAKGEELQNGESGNYWTSQINILRQVKEKFQTVKFQTKIKFTVSEMRRYPQERGFDDYCEAHELPYNDECPECKNHQPMIDQPKLLRWVKATGKNKRFPPENELVHCKTKNGRNIVTSAAKGEWDNYPLDEESDAVSEWLEEYTEPERPDQPQAEVPDKMHPTEVSMLDLIEENRRLKGEIFKLEGLSNKRSIYFSFAEWVYEEGYKIYKHPNIWSNELEDTPLLSTEELYIEFLESIKQP